MLLLAVAAIHVTAHEAWRERLASLPQLAAESRGCYRETWLVEFVANTTQSLHQRNNLSRCGEHCCLAAESQ